jgi:lactoylglutathione lyase
VKLAYTILYVENVEETLLFFEAAFGITRRMLHESGDFGELETGSTALAFSSLKLMRELAKNPSRPDPKSPTFEIAFTVEDVPKALSKALAAGATLIQEPQEMPWGQTTAYVSDPNGFLVELCTAIS